MSTETAKRHERRTEERQPARGFVTLRWSGAAPMSALSRLVDTSKSGFAARHSWPALHPGDIVEFELAWASGRARVVWTRILGKHVESGFLILPEDTC